MGKKILYYFVGRNRKNNDFKVIPIENKWGNRLEEIDLYTTNYSNCLELMKALSEEGNIDSVDMDFFIVSQREKDGNKDLVFYDVLYQNSSKIRSVAEASLKGNIEDDEKNIHQILNHFCWRMKFQPLFYNMVVYGETNLYSKFVQYFSLNRYQDYYSVKYQDGGWVQKSYPLLRNIVDCFHQLDYSFGIHNSYDLDHIYRNMLEESLLEVTNKDYDEKQSNIFELSVEESKEEKMEYILDTFQSLPRGVFYQRENEIVFNEDLFGNYDSDDLEQLKSILGERLSFLVQILSLHTYYYQKSIQKMKNSDKYEKLIEEDYQQIKNLLEEDSDLFKKAYQWSLLYQKYKSRIVGEESGYQYRRK